jgi:cathepsin D
MKGSLVVGAVALAATGALVNGAAVPHSDASLFEQRSSSSSPRSLKMPLYKHAKRDLSDPEQTKKFAAKQREYVRAKWGNSTVKAAALQKRQAIGISDAADDSFYFGQVSIGTPAQNFNIILDTGSSDFWVADSSCTSSQCTDVPDFNSGASSTYRGSSTPFEIEYGSGAVQGTLASDTVSLAGYSVQSQTFAQVTQLAQDTLDPPASGIMGMGFQTLATSGATPFWQVLAESGKLSTNAFTFQLARAGTTSNYINPGGIFTLGEIDSNQYSGSINYVAIDGTPAYWTIAVDAYSVNGASTSVSTDNVAAIDTGTSLIITPTSVATAIYQQINGAQEYGQNTGEYAIPCTSNVDVSITFGGTAYSINSADLNAGVLDSTGQYCLGGIMSEDLGEGAPGYIVGDVFLKNVFSVFRYSPAAVGFASLKGSSAQTTSTTSGSVGTATSGVAAAASSASATEDPPAVFTTRSVAASSATGVVGGSGLSAPVAAGTQSAATAGATSSTASSSGAIVHSPAPVLAMLGAAMLGFFALL